MGFPLRLTLLIVALVLLILVPFAIWHEPIDAYFASAEYRETLESIRPFAWLLGIAMLIGDLVLPIPASQVFSSLGVLYGAWAGGLIGGLGSVLAGLTAYGLVCTLGDRGRRWLASDEELARFQLFFDRWGVAGIIASRGLPVMPEVLAVLAGLARMRLDRFVLALTVGSLPVAGLMAWLGATAGQSSGLIIVLTLVPAALWCVYLLVIARLVAKAHAETQTVDANDKPRAMAETEATASEPTS